MATRTARLRSSPPGPGDTLGAVGKSVASAVRNPPARGSPPGSARRGRNRGVLDTTRSPGNSSLRIPIPSSPDRPVL